MTKKASKCSHHSTKTLNKPPALDFKGAEEMGGRSQEPTVVMSDYLTHLSNPAPQQAALSSASIDCPLIGDCRVY